MQIQPQPFPAKIRGHSFRALLAVLKMNRDGSARVIPVRRCCFEEAKREESSGYVLWAAQRNMFLTGNQGSVLVVFIFCVAESVPSHLTGIDRWARNAAEFREETVTQKKGDDKSGVCGKKARSALWKAGQNADE